MHQSMYKIICLLLLSSSIIAQNSSSMWGTLSMVTIEKEFDAEFGIETIKTDIGPLVQAMDGKDIELEGYIIPLTGQVEQNHFMFSRYPLNMCFFCGKAGPESAAQVFLANEKKVAYTSDKIKVSGRLKVYNDQSSGLIYTIEEGEIIN